MAENGVLKHVILADEIARLAPQDNMAGRRAEILVKHDQLRVTLVTMREGIALDEHATSVPITIQVLTGAFDVSHAGATTSLSSGDFLALDENVPHSVRATADGAFLLTLGWDQD